MDRRAAVQLVDVILGVVVLIGIIVTAPIWYKFIDMASAEAGPLSSLLLMLTVPLLVVALVVSVGVSARR